MPILTAISSVKMTRPQSSTVQWRWRLAYCNRRFRSSFLRKGRRLATLWTYPNFLKAFRTVFGDASRPRSRSKWWSGIRRVFELVRIYISMCRLVRALSLVGQLLRGALTPVLLFLRSPRVPLGIFVILVISHNEYLSPAINPSALLRLARDHSCVFMMFWTREHGAHLCLFCFM